MEVSSMANFKIAAQCFLTITTAALFAGGFLPMAWAGEPANGDFCTGDPIGGDSRSYPQDPSSDINWSAGTSGVADIQSAFNNGRAGENSQLGLSIPMLALPSQATWDGMSNSEKAFWLVNRERIDRRTLGLHVDV